MPKVSVAEEYNELENKIKDLLDQRRPLTKNIVEKVECFLKCLVAYFLNCLPMKIKLSI